MVLDARGQGAPSQRGFLPFRWSSAGATAERRFIHPRLLDVAVFLALLAFGQLQVLSCERSVDFLREDVAYFELGKSLLAGHGYAFNGVAEAVQPPGLSLLLAFAMRVLGFDHSVLLGFTSVLFLLGLLASYWLLRRRYGRIPAAVTCILLTFSPSLFASSTRYIAPALPYLPASVLALLAAAKLDRASSRLRILFWQVALALSLAATLLIQVSGVALLAGVLIWLLVSATRSPARLRPRLGKFLPPLAFGVLAFLGWTTQAGHPTKDWPLAGYPGGYLSQVVLKSGNQPELGRATPIDFVVRVSENGEHYMDLFVGVFTSHWLDLSWSAFVPVTLVLLMMVGLLDSIFRRGSCPHDWYALIYAAIYLLWPWQPELRFLIPVIPFLCIYVYAGAHRLPRIARERPRLVGAIGIPLFSLLATEAVFLALQYHEGGLQLRLSAAIWILGAFVSLWMFLKNASPLARIAGFFRSRPSRWTLGFCVNSGLKTVGLFLLLAHTSLALAQDLNIRDQNLNSPILRSNMRSDIAAASWLAEHSPQGAVIMARHIPITFHYAHRHVVWFPPISSPQVLMDGIRRLGVTHIMVVRRDFYYYLPPDAECFNRLRRAYPTAFQLVGQDRNFQVFSVSAPPPAMATDAR